MAIPNLTFLVEDSDSKGRQNSWPDESESFDQVLSKFYYNCSHGLRGPMASIEGLGHLIETETGGHLTYPKLMNNAIEEMKTITSGFKNYYSSVGSSSGNKHDQLSEATFGAQLLDQLVYTCTDGLKKPVHSIKQLIGEAQSNAKSVLEEKYLDMANKSLKKIENFSADVEIFAMNEKERVHKEKIDLKTLVNTILTDMDCDCSPNFSLSIDQPRHLVTDKERLKIILQKLILNAICFRFPQDKAQISISVAVSTLGLQVKVKDNGIGINKQHLDKIFNMFWRASNVSSGCGLGLYVANKITDRMYGSIQVKSQPGQGSEFTVELPNYHYFDSLKGLKKIQSRTIADAFGYDHQLWHKLG